MSCDSTIIAWTIQKTMRNYHLQCTFDNKEILTKTILAGDLLKFYNCICQWYETENLVPTPRKSEEEEEIDVNPQQLTKNTQIERSVSQAWGDSMLKLVANRETLIHRASEQATCASTMDIGTFCITSDSVFDGNSSTLLEPNISQNSRLRAILIDNVKMDRWQESKYSKLPELWI